MKILVLTKNNPVEVLNTVQAIRNKFYNDNLKFFCDSPHLIAWEIEEKKGIPYTTAFFPAIKIFEKNKDLIADKVDVFITVGTTNKDSITWYDVIVGLDNFDIKDYKQFDTSIYQCQCYTLKDSDIHFDTINELLFFINKIVRIKDNKDDNNKI